VIQILLIVVLVLAVALIVWQAINAFWIGGVVALAVLPDVERGTLRENLADSPRNPPRSTQLSARARLTAATEGLLVVRGARSRACR